MESLVEYIARELVDDPDAVSVESQSRGRNMVNLKLTVAKDDMGRVIGRGGRVANAIRNVLRVAAIKQGKRANLEIR